MDDKKLKILLVNHSDTAGGASVVTRRLMNALCAEGVDARMLVVHKNTDSLRVSEAAKSRRSTIPFLAEHAHIFLHNGFKRDTLFKISTAKFGLPLHRHPWVKTADVIILNWINQGMLSLKEIRRIAAEKPVVWTMHDAWNMTGVCHVLADCERWKENECTKCPLVGRGRMAQKIFKAKKKLYDRTDIRFVAVSNRLAELCRESPLMADANISVIPNAFPVDKFEPVPTLSKAKMGLPETGKIIVMGAARLDDPVKNLPLAIHSLNNVGQSNLTAVFYGDLRNPEILKELTLPYIWLGRITDHNRLQSLMAHADVVLSTSSWETLPGTLVEGISCGAVAVSTDNGGQSDIIEDGVNGFIVRNTDDIPTAIQKALSLPQDDNARAQRHHSMAVRFGAPAVARSYIRLCNTLLEKQG